MEQQTAESKTDSKTILVVDDDEAILKFISGFLPQSGFNVLVAGSTKDALKQSKEYNGPIHLLLSNLQMPGMTGIELGTKLTLERPDIRVMLIRREIPRLCRGGSRSLTNPGVCFSPSSDTQPGKSALRNIGLLLLIGCDQAPLRGQQPESLRLCRRIVTVRFHIGDACA